VVVADAVREQRELAELISEQGLEIIRAGSAAAAQRILLERSVDVVVAEESLPGSGSSLLETIHQRWPSTGRILVGHDLGPDILIQAINRARVHRVLYRKMPAAALRAEFEAALNEVLLERSSSACGAALGSC
jgi:response regulator RpfG family c-di-GMP phosphodiesterase